MAPRGMNPVPNRNKNRTIKVDVAGARLNAEREALHEVSGKFATGVQQNKGEKRARTRKAAKSKAIREDLA